MDVEETKESVQRKKLAKEARDLKKTQKVVDTWVEIVQNKLVQRTKKANGNVYTRYLGMMKDPKTKAYVKANPDKIRK